MSGNAVSNERENASEAWVALARWLPSRDPDSDYWWKTTGPDFAYMLQAADYPIHQQYNALLFHYQCTVPSLGPAPTGGKLHLASALCDGMPLEYSWKWNTPKGKPSVQYAMEAINRFSVTEADPMNQDPARDFLRRVKTSLPSMDYTGANHFFSALYDHDRSKQAAKALSGSFRKTTSIQCVEFLAQGLLTKCYFIPRKLDQRPGFLTLEQWEEAIAQFDPKNAARDALFDFFRNNPEGQSLHPFMLAVDNIGSDKTRIKLYCNTTRTQFASVREIMRVGGKNPVPDTLMNEFRSLIGAVAGLGPDFDDNAELTLGEGRLDELRPLMHGYVYYFSIGPGAKVPNAKCYLPTRYRGPDDLTIARSLTDWMTAHGRGQYCKQFLSTLQMLSQHRPLEEGKSLQFWVSCLIGKDGLDVTSYLPTPLPHA